MEICVLLGNQFHKVKSHYLSPVGRGLEDFFLGGGGNMVLSGNGEGPVASKRV